MKSITAVASMFGLVCAEGGSYNYAANGADWGSIPTYEDCAKDGGSPINLETETNQYNMYDIAEDNLSTKYSNQEDVNVSWLGHTS